jgi:hypothetical protein
MEPGITREERSQRGAWAQRRENLDRRGWEIETGTEAEGSVPGRRMAADSRLRLFNKRLREAKVVMATAPKTGDLFDRFVKDHGDYPWRLKTREGPWTLTGRALWVLLSGVAHGRQWATITLVVKEPVGPAPGSTNSSSVNVSGSEAMMLAVTATAIATSEAALRDLVDYRGRFG